MTRIAARIALAGLLAALLAGCAGGRPPPAIDAAGEASAPALEAPSDYRAQVAKAMKSALKDPDSVKSPEITAPFSGFVGLLNGGNATVVCVRLNAKNGFGGYTGIQETALIFNGGKVANMIGNQPLTCNGRQYGPFPEMLPPAKS